MNYATRQDLVDRFGETELVQLTDRATPRTGAIDDAIVGRALADAASEIDGYLRKVHRLPLTAVPSIVTKRAADIARYYLHGKAAGRDDQVTRAYAEAVRWLKDVAAGLTMLDEDGESPAPAPEGGGRVAGSSPVFTRDALRGF